MKKAVTVEILIWSAAMFCVAFGLHKIAYPADGEQPMDRSERESMITAQKKDAAKRERWLRLGFARNPINEGDDGFVKDGRAELDWCTKTLGIEYRKTDDLELQLDQAKAQQAATQIELTRIKEILLGVKP